MPLFLNNVTLAGNLTRDPEKRIVGNQQSVVNFGLAINRRYTSNTGERKEEVTFIDVEAWGKTAELVDQYLSKGRNVLIEGRLKLDQWEDQNGQKRSRVRVVANRIHFLNDGRGQGGSGGQQQGGYANQHGGHADGNTTPPNFQTRGHQSYSMDTPDPKSPLMSMDDLGDDEPPF